MGKVFTYREIRDREVPSVESFNAVLREVRSGLGQELFVTGAILCGSVIYGGHTRRSDIDCLVVYDGAYEFYTYVLPALQDIETFAHVNHVPIEFIPVSADFLGTRLHHIAPTFAGHLERSVARGGLIKENPLPQLKLDHVDLKEDFRSYLRNKMRSGEKRILLYHLGSPEEKCRALQKALESPMHIARKLLLVKGVTLNNDSKREVRRRYREVATDEEYGLFAGIEALDRAYDAALERQLTGIPDMLEYYAALRNLEEALAASAQFSRLTALRHAA